MDTNHHSRENWREQEDFNFSKWASKLSAGQIAKWMLVLGIVGSFLIFFVLYNDHLSLRQLAEDFYANFGTELVSIGITVLVIDELNKRRAEADEKKRLILQMGSPINGFAIEAIRQLTAYKMLWDGSLRKIKLIEANLGKCRLDLADMEGGAFSSVDFQGARMRNVNLKFSFLAYPNFQDAYLLQSNFFQAEAHLPDFTRANLVGSNLQNVKFHYPDFTDANMALAQLQNAQLVLTVMVRGKLQKAKMNGATLQRANFEEADLSGADLIDTDLWYANLDGAQLKGTNLKGAILLGAKLTSKTVFDETTILPDGSYWEFTINMERFTNSQHPDFYEPSGW